jgi:hypothetical protein
MLSGSAILFVDGCRTGFIVSVSGVKGRNVEKSDTEQTIRGSKQAFVENFNTNIVLIRNMIKSPDLSVEIIKVGKRSRTNTGIVYLKGVINKYLPRSGKKYLL